MRRSGIDGVRGAEPAERDVSEEEEEESPILLVIQEERRKMGVCGGACSGDRKSVV